jgi:hypothetical protein
MRPDAVHVAKSLRQNLSEAVAAYRRATDEYGRLMISSPGNRPSVDDDPAVRHALMIHEQARRKFQQALEELSEFLLRGEGAATEPAQ